MMYTLHYPPVEIEVIQSRLNSNIQSNTLSGSVSANALNGNISSKTLTSGIISNNLSLILEADEKEINVG